MLDNVHRIDWEALGVKNMPNVLRDLCSNDGPTRWTAQNELAWSWPAEAIPFILPFLVELVEFSEVQDRDVILGNFIAAAVTFPDDNTKARFPAGIPSDLAIAINMAVQAGIPVYKKALGDINPAVRDAARSLLDLMRAKGLCQLE